MDTMAIHIARGLLMLRPAMGTAMDMAMIRPWIWSWMVMGIHMARDLLMLRPAMDMAMDMVMEATDMGTVMDTAMDTDTMDKRSKTAKVSFWIQYQEFSEHFMKLIYKKSSHDLPCCYTLNKCDT